jgi:hypothetical protein
MEFCFDDNAEPTARMTVDYAFARAQAMGITLSAEAIELYEAYADGNLTAVELGAAFVKLHGLDSLPPPAAARASPS